MFLCECVAISCVFEIRFNESIMYLHFAVDNRACALYLIVSNKIVYFPNVGGVLFIFYLHTCISYI